MYVGEFNTELTIIFIIDSCETSEMSENRQKSKPSTICGVLKQLVLYDSLKILRYSSYNRERKANSCTSKAEILSIFV